MGFKDTTNKAMLCESCTSKNRKHVDSQSKRTKFHGEVRAVRRITTQVAYLSLLKKDNNEPLKTAKYTRPTPNENTTLYVTDARQGM